MAHKTLHMIGNSHIDPVWFWVWEEGMQEVHATLRSALDRMKEFPDFHFTATSAAFFVYLERIDPGLLEEIRQRVREGRFELTGGWWIEPDCNLPCGEAFARQALYGQATLQRLFGQRATIGSNVDSFGHSPQLPQLLRLGGLEGYVLMRPNVSVSPRELVAGRSPVFVWQGLDGTGITTVSLPGEYTTWFYDATRENIQRTLDAMGTLTALPCCYGVGNHGGGPTVANIRAVEQLRETFPDTELRFSTYGAFFDALRRDHPDLPTTAAYLDHINAGCYSADHLLKQSVRQAEGALLRAEKLQVMARLLSAEGAWQDTGALWQRLLFNQFHDTLGGTIIEEAHTDALNDVRGVTHDAGVIANLAMQAIVASLRMPGKGVPILLFNLSPEPWEGAAEVELNWFCNSDLRLTDDSGQEVPYARVKQSCTMVWLHLGGRRKILFRARIPAFGVAVYYADDQESHLRLPTAHEGDAHVLDNGLVSLRLDKAGQPVSLRDVPSGYEALTAPCAFSVWQDDRDPWGGNGHSFQPDDRTLVTDSVDCVERSDLRQVLRVCQHGEGLRIETHYTLLAGERSVRMDCRVSWALPWHQLRFVLPTGAAYHTSECPYGVMRHEDDDDELFMQRFLDAAKPDGRGLAITNDGIYGFQPRAGATELLLLRSPIYAQGADRSLWQHDYDTYHYLDMGEHAFSLTLTPHGAPLPPHALYRLAERHEQGTLYLVGGMTDRRGQRELPALRISSPAVRIGTAKRAERSEAIMLRLHETDGVPVTVRLSLGDSQWTLSFHPFEIKTLLLEGGQLRETNFLED